MALNHHHKSLEPLSAAYRAARASKVKNIQFANTQVENIFVRLRQETREDGRSNLQSLKRPNCRLYNFLVELKDLEFWS